MAFAIRIYVDLQNRGLVQAFNSTSPAVFPTLRQGEEPTLQLFFLDNSNATPSQPYAFFAFPGATIKLGIMQGKPTGGADTLIAAQFLWSPITNGFQAMLDCNTTEIATALAGVSQVDCTTEIEVTPSGEDPVKYFQGPMVIQAAVIDPASPTPAPLPSYMTRDEALATFLKFINLPGETCTLVSIDGTKATIIGTNNDGSFDELPVDPYVP